MKFYCTTDQVDGVSIAIIQKGKAATRLSDSAAKKKYIIGLVIKDCPLGPDFENSQCPARQVRLLATSERIACINSLSEEEINRIYNYHEDCCSFFSIYEKSRNDRLVGINVQ